MPRSAAFVAGWLGCAALAAAALRTPDSLRAQTPPARSAQSPTFRGRVDLVPLDVSVWDKDHNPVKGLTADRFSLLEDDTPRQIVTFAAVDIPDPPPPTAAWMRDAPKDVETNDVTDRRLFMILVDDASFGNVTLFPSQLALLKETARTVIRHLGPSDLAAVFFTGDNRHGQEFTADHARLLAAVNAATGVTLPGDPRTGMNLGDTYSVTVGERAVEALLDTPGRRKALVQIKMLTRLDHTSWPELPPYLVARTEAMFEKAQRAGVNVYTMTAGDPRTKDLPALDESYWEDTWYRRVAHETGGEAFDDVALNPVAAEQAVTKIFQANSSYYILGYSSTDLQKFHFIKVSVAMPGVEVRTRDKYYWPDPGKPAPPGPPPPPLLASIAGALPKADVPMWTSPMVFANANLSGATIASITRVRLAPPDSPPAAGATKASLETFVLRTRLFTAEGVARGEVTTESSARVAGEAVDAEVWSEIAAPKPGLYELRLAVQRPAANLDGSVYATVDVPNFARAPVSLSSLVVSTTDWGAYGPRDEMAKLLPAPPTTRRDFAQGERVRAYVRVYQGGSGKTAAVDVHVQIINDHDAAVVDRREALAASRFDATRGTDERVDLPTATLPPGPYLLRIDATAGKTTATREIRFSVR